MRAIAFQLKRSPSTISREINRDGGCYEYRATHSDEAALARAKRPKQYRLASHRSLNKVTDIFDTEFDDYDNFGFATAFLNRIVISRF
jgi:IS30 family transposase